MQTYARSLLGFFVLPLTVGMVGCATRYQLEPTVEKPEMLNGIPLGTLVTPKCVFQLGSESSNADEMLLRVRVTNKSEAAFDFAPTSLSISAKPEILPTTPITALDPEAYVKELKTAAETFESRTRMDSFQGIEALGTLKGEASDASIDSANSQYREKQKDAASSQEKAAALRKRIAAIEPAALKKTTLKPGDRAEGIVVFKSAFTGEGPIEVEVTGGPCAGKLGFLLKD